MAVVTAWLPPAANGAFEIAIAKLTERWTQDWFSGSGQVIVNAALARSTRSTSWSAFDSVTIGMGRNGFAVLGSAICNGIGEPENRRDRRILEELGTAACQDLAQVFGATPDAALIGKSDGVELDRLARFTVACAQGKWTLVLALGAETLIFARQHAAQSGMPPTLGSLAAGLANEDCPIVAHLGRATISTGELAAISKGDVIQFDRGIQAPVPLVIAGRNPAHGSARVVMAGRDMCLTMTDPISIEAREAAPA